MGLAERFKQHIENKDLFSTTENNLSKNEKNIRFISKPINIPEEDGKADFVETLVTSEIINDSSADMPETTCEQISSNKKDAQSSKFQENSTNTIILTKELQQTGFPGIEKTLDKKMNFLNTQKNIQNNSDIQQIGDEILNKISKTPYWDEFSDTKKTSMIKKYFIKRVPENEQQEITNELIEEILEKTTK